MGTVKTVKDALETLLLAAAPTGVAVVVGVDPMTVEHELWTEAWDLVLDSRRLDPSPLLGTDHTQTETWEWSVYVLCSGGGKDEDSMDRFDAHVTLLRSALVGNKLADPAGNVNLVEGAEFVGWRPGTGVIYRLRFSHFYYES